MGEIPKAARYAGRQKYTGGPAFVGEFGGIRWQGLLKNNDANRNWGYGETPERLEEFKARYKGLTDVLLDNSRIMGFCYPQLTDIELLLIGLWPMQRFALR